jgi:hypothetical protein
MRAAIPCEDVRIVQDLPAATLARPTLVAGGPFEHLATGQLDWDRGVVTLLDAPSLLEAARVRR